MKGRISTDTVVPLLAGCPLFVGIAREEMAAMLNCLDARTKNYEKGEYLVRPGDTVYELGVVLSGEVYVVRDDCWGHHSIIASVGTPGLFAEAFACMGQQNVPIGVVAAAKSEVLMVDCRKITDVCSQACAFHTRLIQNLLRILAIKNTGLMDKMGHLTQRSTREKVLSYLSRQSFDAKSERFEVPFNRQGLADYLSVDRSALSNELGKLRDEGIIEFHKSTFVLPVPPVRRG
ncbi:MAG: Crp/Fnr family transcriptional regulator [Raoultibacter sp.]